MIDRRQHGRYKRLTRGPIPFYDSTITIRPTTAVVPVAPSPGVLAVQVQKDISAYGQVRWWFSNGDDKGGPSRMGLHARKRDAKYSFKEGILLFTFQKYSFKEGILLFQWYPLPSQRRGQIAA